MLGLDFEGDCQSHACIRIALLPVGDMDGATYRRLASMVKPLGVLDLASITHNQRSGTVRLRFLEAGGGASDWDDLYPQRRVRAVVGLAHFPSERNLGQSFRSFMRRVAEFLGPTHGLVADAIAFEWQGLHGLGPCGPGPGACRMQAMKKFLCKQCVLI